MKPYALIIDDFLDCWDDVRAYADTAEFGERLNPIDGITYPEVLEIADQMQVANKLSAILGSRVKIRLMVFRRSPLGVACPEMAHEDVSIYGSQYTMILYMNRSEHCIGGTSLLRHCPSGTENGVADVEWKKNRNALSAWETVITAPMRPNRAFIFPSCLIHRSDPVGGFGSTPEDSRLAIACLFDLVPADA